MAFAISRVSGANSATDAQSYNLTAFTPTAGATIVVIAHVWNTAVTVAISDNTATGLSAWTQRGTEQTWGTSSANRSACWTAVAGGSPSSTTIAITCTGDDATGINATVFEITGTSVTYVQRAQGGSTASESPSTVTFSANLNTSNAYVACFAVDANPASMDPPAGWTEGVDVGHTGPEGHSDGYRINGETGTTVTWTPVSSTRRWGAFALEFSEGAGGGGQPTARRSQQSRVIGPMSRYLVIR